MKTSSFDFAFEVNYKGQSLGTYYTLAEAIDRAKDLIYNKSKGPLYIYLGSEKNDCYHIMGYVSAISHRDIRFTPK